MFIVDFTFNKKGILKYISHLDLLRLFSRAARRAGFPLWLTRGFSAHPKIVIKRALKLGFESDKEEAQLFLTRTIEKDEFIQRLNTQLPRSVQVLSVDGVLERPGA